MASKQAFWRECSKCSGLVYFGLARCPAGGVHDHVQSGNYFLRVDNGPGQHSWKWCTRCQTLSFTGNGTTGPCPSGGNHDTYGSSDYTLTLDQDTAPGQNNWRWCNKCQGLFWAGGSSLGKCQMGGEHDHSGSGNYTLSFDGDPVGSQGQWRWCNKCMMLAYDGYATCAAGGPHINTGSDDYTLTLDNPSALGQKNWKWCKKCFGIAYAGGPSLGSCPKGDDHDYSGSGNYVLREGSYPGSQDHWSWCNKCQLLWYSGNGTAPCPEGYHNDSDSANYALEFQAAGPLPATSSTSVPTTASTSIPSGTHRLPTGNGRSISTAAIAGIAVGVAVLCLIVVCVVLLLRYRRRQKQRAAVQAGTEQHYDHGFSGKREPEARTTKPLLKVVERASDSKAPVAATLAPSEPVELDGEECYEMGTCPPTSSPWREK